MIQRLSLRPRPPEGWSEADFLACQESSWVSQARSRERDECRSKLARLGLLAPLPQSMTRCRAWRRSYRQRADYRNTGRRRADTRGGVMSALDATLRLPFDRRSQRTTPVTCGSGRATTNRPQ